MGLEAGGWGDVEEEKIPHICESIGHRPLWGRCPAPSLNYHCNLLKQGTGTADHLTLLRLLSFLVPHSSLGLSRQMPDINPYSFGFCNVNAFLAFNYASVSHSSLFLMSSLISHLSAYKDSFCMNVTLR